MAKLLIQGLLNPTNLDPDASTPPQPLGDGRGLPPVRVGVGRALLPGPVDGHAPGHPRHTEDRQLGEEEGEEGKQVGLPP